MSHYGHLCCNSSLFFCDYSRSSAGYTPLDFAFVVAGSKGVIEVLDRDRQLPREGNPLLDRDIVEVRMETSVSDVQPRLPYFHDQTLWVLFIASRNLLRPLFEGGH